MLPHGIGKKMNALRSTLSKIENLLYELALVKAGKGSVVPVAKQDAPPPPLQRPATSIVDEIPRLKTGVYDKWWAERKEDLEATYALATDDEYWVMASEHLRLASIPMRKTHDAKSTAQCATRNA